MAKLMDIKGYWDEDWNFDDNDDMWKGQILLSKDGWFEGIAVNPNSYNYKEDRFIFGIYYPDKIIELFKISPKGVSSPFVYHGRRDAKGYVGEVETFGSYGKVLYGNSNIITQYVETVRQDIDVESQILALKIQRFKDIIMDEDSKKIYENIIAMRSTLTESVLKNYEEDHSRKRL